MDGDKVVAAAAVVVVVAVVVDDVTAAKVVVDVGALVVVVVVVEDVIVCCGDSVRLAAATLLATLSRVSTMAVSAETKDSSVTSPMVGWTVSLTTVALANLPRAPEVGANSGDGERFSGKRLRINRTIPVGVSALLTMGTAVVVVVVVVVVAVVVVLVASALGLSCALNCSCADPCLRWITDNRRPNPTDQSSCTRSKSSSSNRSP